MNWHRLIAALRNEASRVDEEEQRETGRGKFLRSLANAIEEAKDL